MKTLLIFLTMILMAPIATFAQIDSEGNDIPDEKKAPKSETKLQVAPDKNAEAQKEEMGEEEMMQKWMELISLGEEHETMATDVGSYKYFSTFWISPGAEPMKSEGETTVKAIMDGRYFIEKHKGESMGMLFEGMSVYGYDKVEKKYVSTWIDNMGTGILIFTGNYNDKGQLVSMATITNPMTMQLEKHKIVITKNDKGHIMDYYVIQPEGMDFKTMNIEYFKIKEKKK